MKKVKILTALAALMTLGLASCGGDQPVKSGENSPAATSAAGTSKAASASASKSSSKAATTSKSVGPDYTKVIAHTWTDGTPAANSDGKNYIPLTDTAANKVGVKIAIADWTAAEGAEAGTELGSDGKIAPSNKTGAAIYWKVKAPKAGDYQMIMTAKSSSGQGEGKTLSERGVTVKLNGTDVDIQGDRDVLTLESAAFVVAPTIHLTGGEDTITITACYYRPVFDMTSYVLFAEH